MDEPQPENKDIKYPDWNCQKSEKDKWIDIVRIVLEGDY
jgi:hypothetical protein